MVPAIVKTLSAAAILAVLIAAFVRHPKMEVHSVSDDIIKRLKIIVGGMSCESCARTVRRALMENPGVDSAEIDLKRGVALVEGNDFDESELRSSIEELGYKFAGSETLNE